METFERLESNVRGYCRDFPTVFTQAKGHHVWDEQGRRYVDFFAGAGVLNYGHNNPRLKKKVMEYLMKDGVVHGLDMATEAKRAFLNTFEEVILKPRGLSYKVQFPGPTGTNAVESAMKLARKVTGRHNIVAFTRGFHGMTMGALAATANAGKRGGASVPLNYTTTMPYDGYYGDDIDTVMVLERHLDDAGSGLDKPAAVLVETVQGEGGVNPARFEWLKRLAEVCRAHDVLLIVDDIQMGCGRTGPFFSFEPVGITPDIVTLSKSIGGIGLPMAVVLIRPDLDQWKPGEHNGTFRGNNLAFVAATEALDAYWRDDAFAKATEAKGRMVRQRLEAIQRRFGDVAVEVRGRGLIQGIVFGPEGFGDEVIHQAFEDGLIIETSGPRDEVVKVMPPLTIDEKALCEGLDILESAVEKIARKTTGTATSDAA